MKGKQLAIWKRMTDEQRQRVIDARWETIAGRYGPGWGCWLPGQGFFCPFGFALPELGTGSPDSDEVAFALSDTIDLFALDTVAGGDMDRFLALYEREQEAIKAEAGRFADDWDHGQIPPSQLVASLRQMQAVSHA